MEDIKLIRKRGVDEDEVRFYLEPLAEHLTAMYLAEKFANDDNEWKTFIENLKKDKENLERNLGFIYAMQNCCSTKYAGVISQYAANEFASLAKIESADRDKKISENRTKQIIREMKLIKMEDIRLIKDEISNLENTIEV